MSLQPFKLPSLKDKHIEEFTSTEKLKEKKEKLEKTVKVEKTKKKKKHGK